MAGPLEPNANGGLSNPGDVAAAYDALEQSIEAMYAKLIADAKGNKEAIEDQIKQIDCQIDSIKDQILKLEKMLEAIQKIMPLLIECLNQQVNTMRWQPGADEARRNALAQQLTAIMQQLGIQIDDPAEEIVNNLVDGMGAGGNGAMAIAFFILFAVSEAAGDAAVAGKHATEGFVQCRLDAPVSQDFTDAKTHGLEIAGLTLPASDFQTAGLLSQLPFGQGEAAGLQFLATRLGDQITAKIQALTKEIEALLKAKKALREVTKTLDEQIAWLGEQKEQALKELKKQKQKALGNA